MLVLRGDLWGGHGGVRVVEEHLAELVALVDRRRERYGQRGGAVEPAAAGDAAGDARAGERGELAVHWGFE